MRTLATRGMVSGFPKEEADAHAVAAPWSGCSPALKSRPSISSWHQRTLRPSSYYSLISYSIKINVFDKHRQHFHRTFDPTWPPACPQTEVTNMALQLFQNGYRDWQEPLAEPFWTSSGVFWFCFWCIVGASLDHFFRICIYIYIFIDNHCPCCSFRLFLCVFLSFVLMC